MAETLAAVSAALYCVWWPVAQLLRAARLVGLVIASFWSIAQFVLLPITSLLHAILSVLLFPLRLQLLDRVETIYIYLGIAGLVGCSTGIVLHFAFRFLATALCIDESAQPSRRRNKLGTAVEYRAARQERRTDVTPSSPSPTVRKDADPRRRGLLSQTILEEEDSDF